MVTEPITVDRCWDEARPCLVTVFATSDDRKARVGDCPRANPP